MKFHEQMKLLRDENKNFDNVWPNDDWDIQDYKDMFWLIDRGYLVQMDYLNSFTINGEWEGEDIYEEEFVEEVEECDCESDDEYSVSKSGCDNVACGNN